MDLYSIELNFTKCMLKKSMAIGTLGSPVAVLSSHGFSRPKSPKKTGNDPSHGSWHLLVHGSNFSRVLLKNCQERNSHSPPTTCDTPAIQAFQQNRINLKYLAGKIKEIP